jgi:hypothetical protein
VGNVAGYSFSHKIILLLLLIPLSSLPRLSNGYLLHTDVRTSGHEVMGLAV